MGSRRPSPPLRPTWLIPAIVVVLGGAIASLFLMTSSVVTMRCEVVRSYPHQSEKTYTQGLEFYKGFLFESSGKEGQSDWRIVNLTTGEVCLRQGLPSDYFGEGITVLNERLYMLTWRDRECLVFDLSPLRLDEIEPDTVTAASFNGRRPKQQRTKLKYSGEGWGLTNDGTHVIMSNGGSDGMIRYRDPDTFEVVREIQVVDDGRPVGGLNELEMVDGHIYANVFTTNTIVKIDPASGNVVARIDLSSLPVDRAGLGEDEVLNGIAHDRGRTFVTGKNWPNLYEVRFVPE